MSGPSTKEALLIAARSNERSLRNELLLFSGCWLALAYNHLLLLGEPFIGNNRYFLEDDLFYYFGIAWNFIDLGYWSFDGHTATNGVQPFWAITLSALAAPFRLFSASKHDFAVGSLMFGAAIGAAALLLHDKIFRRVFDISEIESALITLALAVALGPYLSNGMESGLKLLMLLVLFYAVFIRDECRPFVIALILFASFLARVDSLVVLAALSPLMILKLGFNKTAIAYGGFASLIMIYGGLNQLLFGSFLPISGSVKRWWDSLVDQSLSVEVQQTVSFLSADLNMFVERIVGLERFGLAALILFVGVYAIGRLISFHESGWKLKTEDYWHLFILALLASSFALYMFYVFETLRPHRWYFPEAYYAVLCAGFYLLTCIPWRFSKAAGSAAIIVIAVGMLTDFRHRQEIREIQTWARASQAVVEWLEANTKPGDNVGVWSAGQIGYFAPRSVYNLEGLVADYDMLKANRNLALLEYIKKQDIRFIIQWFPIADFPHDRIDCAALSDRDWKKWHSSRLYVIRQNCEQIELIDILTLKPPLDGYAIYFFSVLADQEPSRKQREIVK